MVMNITVIYKIMIPMIIPFNIYIYTFFLSCLTILIIYDYIIPLYNDYNDYPIIMGIIEYIIDMSFNLLMV